MKWWHWILALLPAGVGLVIGTITSNDILQNPLLYLRGELSAVALRAGLTLSLIAVVVGLVVDRSQRRHKQELRRLQQDASEERRRFLQRLDHEVKNPLTAIQTGLNNIRAETTSEYIVGEIDAVSVQVRRLGRLAGDLRKLAVLELTSVDKSDVDMRDLINEAILAVQESSDSAEREFTLLLSNAPWPLPMVNGDPDLLLLAIHNLLDNAIKFSMSGDRIEVRAFEDGKEIVVEVADTGQGIPDAETEHVWEELFRGVQARGVPGSGLGLSLVKVIVEQHGGSVGLRSRPEQGTVFHMRLPIS